MLKPFREFLLLFQRPQHVVHGRPFPFQRPHHAVRQTDGLAGIPRCQRRSGLLESLLHIGRVKPVTLLDASAGFLHRGFRTTEGVGIGFQLRGDHRRNFVGFLGLFLRKRGFGFSQDVAQLLDTITAFSVERSGGFEDGLLGFRPPHDDVAGPFLGLTEELFALP